MQPSRTAAISAGSACLALDHSRLIAVKCEDLTIGCAPRESASFRILGITQGEVLRILLLERALIALIERSRRDGRSAMVWLGS